MKFNGKAGRVLNFSNHLQNLIGKDNPMLTSPLKNKLTYFQRDQLAFFVTHPGQDDPNKEQVAVLLNTSSQILAGLGYQTRLEPQSVYSFPRISDKDYESKLDERRKPQVMPRPESSFISANILGADENPKDPLEFFQLVTRLDEELRNVPVTGLEQKAVLLDWLASGSRDGSGTGGPGGWPVAYRGSPERAPFRFNDLPEIVTKGNRGEGVDVLILDTAISLQEKVVAYIEEKDRHPLIRSLLRPDGPLHIEPLPQPQREHIAELRALGHDYRMSDHGLFVAGLIHTIVPCAEIYLVEVLNSYGVGDLDSIVWGLDFAIRHIQKNPGRRVVVNFSLCLDLPIGEQHCRTIPVVDPCFPDLFTEHDRRLEEAICRQIEKDSNWFEDQILALQTSCDAILELKSRVIAAAGNDRRPGQSVAPHARYPAAIKSAQGVGALPKTLPRKNGKLKKASYSNQADSPQRIGITTLGGEEGEGQGVLGLYLGEFPCGEPNCTKWAWWSGTSFATPLVSGVTAAVLGDMPESGREAYAAIEELYRIDKIVDGDGEQEEDGLSLIQS
jgi:hypothetical protein